MTFITKQKLLNIPDKIFEILEEHKKITGRSMSSMIMEALYKWMIHERLMMIRTRIVYIDKEVERTKKQTIPNAIMYCDSDKCQVIRKDGC